MSTDPQTEYITEYIAALTELHRGLDRKGPGDGDFSLHLLSRLPALPSKPRMADLGCGSGAGALLLAEHYQSTVMAVDASAAFIDELKTRANQMGLEHLITPIQGDMAQLDWAVGAIDLLWSEGAAYNLGFEQALKIWRSLLSKTGIAVLSELSWFTEDRPEAAIAYWQNAYPMMANEAENIARATRSGFRVCFTQRLPSQAWWANYYGPLRERMRQLETTTLIQTSLIPAVIQETEAEISLFEQFSDSYGYTFYVLQVT